MSRRPEAAPARGLLRRPFPIARLRDSKRQTVHIAATPGELRALAEWLDIVDVRALHADLTLTAEGTRRLLLTGRLSCAVVQTCVATLEPVEAAVEAAVSRVYLLDPQAGAAPDEDAEVLPGDILDLGPPVAEELSLALDPYPRAKAAALPDGGTADSEAAEAPATVRPFAGLDKLTRR